MKPRNWREYALLLARGAGIAAMPTGVSVDRNFSVDSPKAAVFSPALVDILADEIEASRIEFDFLTLFVNRPATLRLCLMLAAELTRRLRKTIGVLSIAREKLAHAEFRFYEHPSAMGVNLVHVSTGGAAELLRGKKTLLFTDVLRGDDNEGIVRTVEAPAVRRAKVEIVGLATFAIGQRGGRKRLRRALNNADFPVLFLIHFGEKFDAGKPKDVEERARSWKDTSSLLDRLLGRT